MFLDAKIDGLLDELLGQLVRRVRDKVRHRPVYLRQLRFHQEVHARLAVAVFVKIRCNHAMPCFAQHFAQSTVTGSWLPDHAMKRFSL